MGPESHEGNAPAPWPGRAISGLAKLPELQQPARGSTPQADYLNQMRW
jgi:hypothetical protein